MNFKSAVSEWHSFLNSAVLGSHTTLGKEEMVTVGQSETVEDFSLRSSKIE